MNYSRSLLVLVGIFGASAALAAASDVLVKVALLNGAPVYHWRVFKSAYHDDVDRALVLREFKRQGFTLPEHFVEEQLQTVVAKNFHGDQSALEESLKRSGASMAEYKQFLPEEVTLAAFQNSSFSIQHSKEPDSPAARNRWVESLRKSAKVTLLQ